MLLAGMWAVLLVGIAAWDGSASWSPAFFAVALGPLFIAKPLGAAARYILTGSPRKPRVVPYRAPR